MALRLKMIEFAATVNTTSLAAATKRTLTGATSIFIPESTLTFKSCIVEVFVSTDGATAQSMTTPVINFNLGTVAETGQTFSSPAANSGEAQAWQLAFDVTSYFTTNWAGVSMPWTVAFTGTGAVTTNHSAKVTITYQYEESTSPTQVKTVRIPIESTLTTLTASYATLGGGAAIPPFKGTYLPESGITVRQIFLDLQAQEGTNSTVNFTSTVRINSGTTYVWWTSTTGALNSARWARSWTDITPLNLTGSTNYYIEAVSSLATRMSLLGGTVTCTYEFNATGSTSILNSLILGASDVTGWIGGTTIGDQDVWERTIYIEEPDTIGIRESAVALYFNDTAGFTLNLQVTGTTSGQTSASAYVVTAGAVQCGQYSVFHRIDAGGRNGKGLYLKRGKNLYRLLMYSNTNSAGWGLSGYMILNYTSGRHSDGVGVHAKTCFQRTLLPVNAGTLRVATSLTIACPIPETYYYLIGYVPMWAANMAPAAVTTALTQALTIQAEILTTENGGPGGWNSLFSGYSRIDVENANNTYYGAARTNFQRWNGDPDPDRLNVKTSRRYRYDMNPTGYGYGGYYYTYNAITYTVSGTCTTDNAVALTGVTIDIFRIDGTTEELVLTATSGAGGAFSATWIDNTDTIFAVGRYDNTKVGRSNDVIPLANTLDMSLRDPLASGNFNIILSAPTTGRRIFVIS